MIVGIFGAGRNGSTLLMRLLDGSPGLWVYPLELNYLSTFGLRSVRGKLKRAAARLFSDTGVGNRFREGYIAAFIQWTAHQIQELNETYIKHLVDL